MLILRGKAGQVVEVEGLQIMFIDRRDRQDRRGVMQIGIQRANGDRSPLAGVKRNVAWAGPAGERTPSLTVETAEA